MSRTELIAGATPTLRARLWAKIVKRKRRQCWTWRGATCRKRGGARRPKLQVGGRGSRTIVVARILLAFKDRVPLEQRAGLEAGHRCGHFWCVNPHHLEWVGRAENEEAKGEFDEAIDDVEYPPSWDDDDYGESAGA
jgi:hypothetical protein